MYTINMMAYLRILTLVLLLLLPAHTLAGKNLEGPIQAEVTRIVDGDTIDVRAQVWIGHYIETRVRLSDLDTPELRGKCDTERQKALEAQDALSGLLRNRKVILTKIQNGKFAGRVVAKAHTTDGTNISDFLIKHGFGQPYDGGKRLEWCDDKTAFINPDQ